MGRVFKYYLTALPVFLTLGNGGHCLDSLRSSFESRVDLSAFTINLEPAERLIGETWFIGIGINHYQDASLRDLKNAKKDVLDVFDKFCKDYGFKRERSVLLFDSTATRSAILAALLHITQLADGSDNIVVYYAGHGTYSDSTATGVWIPSDARKDNFLTYVSYGDLMNDFVGQCEARHVVIFNDACFGGTMFSHEVRGSSPKIRELQKIHTVPDTGQTTRSDDPGMQPDAEYANMYYDKLEQIYSRELFTSGRREQVLDGAAGTHSPFAQAILDYCNLDHEIFTVAEMAEVVKKTVAMKTGQVPRYGALSSAGDDGGEFVFRKK